MLYIHTKIYLFFYSDRISSPFQERLTLFMKVLSYHFFIFLVQTIRVKNISSTVYRKLNTDRKI